jgi:hypothetical protein
MEEPYLVPEQPDPNREVVPVAAPDRRLRGLTVRSLLIALILIPVNAYWVIMMEVVRYEGHPTTISLFFNTVFLLAVLSAINSLFARLWPRIALHRNELLVIYCMLCISSALGSHDLIEVLTPQIICPFEFASPENKWADLFLKDLPPYLFVNNPKIYDPAFLGGTTFNTAARLQAWSSPLLYWGAFIFVLTLVMLGMNSLLRKRWTERERLTYPITYLPIEMTTTDGALWRNWWMWGAFIVAASICTVNNLHNLYPMVPLIKVRVIHYDAYMAGLFQGFPWYALSGTRISFYPFAIGMGMLLPTDLAFSCWFFYLFWAVQRLLATTLGFGGIPEFPYVAEQSAAAYIALALFALYMAKDHLRDVWQGLRGMLDPGDAGEPMPNRVSAWMVGLGFVFLIGFSLRMGMWAAIALVVFGIYFLYSLTITRVRAELGPPAHDLHMAGPDQVLTNILGSNGRILPAKQLTGLKMYFWFNRAYRSHPMPIQLESFKIADHVGIPLGAMNQALIIAAAVGIVSAFWAETQVYYVYGISTKMSFVAKVFGTEPFNQLQSWLTNGQPPNFGKAGAYVVGLVVTLVGMALRVRYLWWPFHPVGYAISSSWSMNCLWLPIFIAWLAKWTVLRYFGFQAFQKVIPVALGLVLGEFLVGGAWLLAGWIFNFNAYAFWV